MENSWDSVAPAKRRRRRRKGANLLETVSKKGGRYRRRGAEREKIQTSWKRGRREGGAVGEGIK